MNLQVPDGNTADVISWGINFHSDNSGSFYFDYGYDFDNWVKDYFDSSTNYDNIETPLIPADVNKPYKIGFYFEYPSSHTVMEKAILKAKVGNRDMDEVTFQIEGMLSN